MKIQFDHIQRLNLHAPLGAQRVDVGSIRAVWAIQDRLALSSDEERALELKREFVGGQERVTWNPALSVDPQEYDLTDAEVSRVRTAIETSKCPVR